MNFMPALAIKTREKLLCAIQEIKRPPENAQLQKNNRIQASLKTRTKKIKSRWCAMDKRFLLHFGRDDFER